MQLSAVTAGFYRFSSDSTIDLHGYIYQNTFDPLNPSLNLRAERGGELGFQLSLFLETNISYILVVTSIVPKQIGSFSIVGHGPNSINARRIGKFDDSDWVRSTLGIT